MKGSRLRIGLNSGEVVVGSIGDNLRMDYTAIGDTTNVAARLQELAEPGTVLTSEAVYLATAAWVEFDSLGEQCLERQAGAAAMTSTVCAYQTTSGRSTNPLRRRQVGLGYRCSSAVWLRSPRFRRGSSASRMVRAVS